MDRSGAESHACGHDGFQARGKTTGLAGGGHWALGGYSNCSGPKTKPGLTKPTLGTTAGGGSGSGHIFKLSWDPL